MFSNTTQGIDWRCMTSIMKMNPKSCLNIQNNASLVSHLKLMEKIDSLIEVYMNNKDNLLKNVKYFRKSTLYVLKTNHYQ